MNPITRMMRRYIKVKYALPLLFISVLVFVSISGCTSPSTPSPSASSAPTAQNTVSPSGAAVTPSPTQASPTAASAAKGTASNSKISVTATYKGIYVSDNQFEQPKAGNKYVQFDVTVTNVNYPAGSIGNQYYFTLFDSKNYGHQPVTASFGEGGLRDINKSDPGQKTAGMVIFEIAQGVNPAYLTYNDYTNDLTITV